MTASIQFRLINSLVEIFRPIINIGRLLRDCWRTSRRLRELGILGMNHRNAACILDYNPRCNFPIVDDKLRMHQLCRSIGVPTPELFAVFRAHAQLRHLTDALADHAEFVVKPARGSAGRGILVITGRTATGYQRQNGQVLSSEQLSQHLSDIISGMYSLGGRPDTALVQQRLRLHPAFAPYAEQGIPDVRVIVYRGQPAMAMLRLPTRLSGGRANLHQGGIGVGVEIASGQAIHAVQHNRVLRYHPDSGIDLHSLRVPSWSAIVAMSCRVAEAVGLGYVGVDVVLDALRGPILLEVNARPGLAIQIANGQGLLTRLRAIDAALARQDCSSRTATDEQAQAATHDAQAQSATQARAA